MISRNGSSTSQKSNLWGKRVLVSSLELLILGNVPPFSVKHQQLRREEFTTLTSSPAKKDNQVCVRWTYPEKWPSLKFWSNTKRAKSDHSKCFTSSAVRIFIARTLALTSDGLLTFPTSNMSLLWENIICITYFVSCFSGPRSSQPWCSNFFWFQVWNTEGSRFLFGHPTPPPKKMKRHTFWRSDFSQDGPLK